MCAPLRWVLVKEPEPAFAVPDLAARHYAGRPDLALAHQEHAALVDILRQAGAEVVFHPTPQPERPDAIFMHDPALITNRGAIVLRMGKPGQPGEEAALAIRLQELGIPILYTLDGPATAEGGDLLWIDHDTLAIGQGFRTTAAGLRQLEGALAGLRVSVVPVPLPYNGAPQACLHLMSLISIVADDLALVYLPLLPVPFWQYLVERGFQLIEVPEAEFHTLGTNVLAMAPRYCLMLAGNPTTRARLEAAGCRVLTYRGDEISLKAEGGPTCLTRPLWRA